MNLNNMEKIKTQEDPQVSNQGVGSETTFGLPKSPEEKAKNLVNEAFQDYNKISELPEDKTKIQLRIRELEEESNKIFQEFQKVYILKEKRSEAIDKIREKFILNGALDETKEMQMAIDTIDREIMNLGKLKKKGQAINEELARLRGSVN